MGPEGHRQMVEGPMACVREAELNQRAMRLGGGLSRSIASSMEAGIREQERRCGEQSGSF